MGNPAMLEVRSRNHVQYTLPDLIEAIRSRLASALKQRRELRWTRAEHERRHA